MKLLLHPALLLTADFSAPAQVPLTSLMDFLNRTEVDYLILGDLPSNSAALLHFLERKMPRNGIVKAKKKKKRKEKKTTKNCGLT